MLCGPASERGMEAYESSWDEEVAAFEGYAGEMQQLTPELIDEVDGLLQGMRKRARWAAKGRAVPPWGGHLEVSEGTGDVHPAHLLSFQVARQPGGGPLCQKAGALAGPTWQDLLWGVA